MTVAGRLQGKVAVVTGGASGIGLATVRRFVAEGASVVFCDLDPDQGRQVAAQLGDAGRLHHQRRETGGGHDGHVIAKELGDACTFVPADITDSEALRACIETAVERYGGLDVMYNNAGVGTAEGSIIECPEAIFDRTIAVDLKAVWWGIKLSAPHLIERGGGSIITTASISGLVGMPGQGAYGAAKGGVVQLTRVAAMELAPHSVRVNAICPGGIVTPIIYDNPGMDATLDPDMIRQGMQQAQPLPRAGEPEDIADAALWLASDESRFVTGQSIAVDGGITAEFDARFRPPRPAATGG